MVRMRFLAATASLLALGAPAFAQQPSVEELLRRMDALQRRVDELEGQARKAKVAARQAEKAAASTTARKSGAKGGTDMAATEPHAGQRPSNAPAGHVTLASTPAIPGLAPPKVLGEPYEDALRSDLPGLSLRIPGAATELRFYGFAKLTAYSDFNGRNQTDVPAAQSIPLSQSAASRQGGDFGMSARFSRFGIDTRTPTDWGTLESRIEGDFAGNAFTSNTAAFRLRQAWVELGTDRFRVLAGQANSLWNEGLFETLNDATNLNQSFVRQAQLRVSGRLAPGLTGQVSLEAPDTQFTSNDGIFTNGTTIAGLSPAFSKMPDLLGRLTYRDNGLELDMRGLLRQLSLRTEGTFAEPPPVKRNELGWGLAGHVRFPMRWVSEGFGADQLVAMAYYGRGIGRYFGGNTSNQDALSDLGAAAVWNGQSWVVGEASLNPLPTYGATAAYRRFWTPQLRSNVEYSYARQDYPGYARGFTAGSLAATSLNGEMQQAIGNLIWSPFAEMRDGVVDTGWLDVGIEFMHTRRNVFGGFAATGTAGAGSGTANRLIGGAIGRF